MPTSLETWLKTQETNSPGKPNADHSPRRACLSTCILSVESGIWAADLWLSKPFSGKPGQPSYWPKWQRTEQRNKNTGDLSSWPGKKDTPTSLCPAVQQSSCVLCMHPDPPSRPTAGKGPLPAHTDTETLQQQLRK